MALRVLAAICPCSSSSAIGTVQCDELAVAQPLAVIPEILPRRRRNNHSHAPILVLYLVVPDDHLSAISSSYISPPSITYTIPGNAGIKQD